MLKKYGEVIVCDNLMSFIENQFDSMFLYNDGNAKISKELMLKNIEWSCKIFYDIQKLIDKIQDNYRSEKYLIVDGGSKLFVIFPDKFDVRFVRVVIDDDYNMQIKENLIIENSKESYYNQLYFMHTKSIDNMLYDFCLA